MGVSRLRILEGGRRLTGRSRVQPLSLVRLVLEHARGGSVSLKDVLGYESAPRRA